LVVLELLDLRGRHGAGHHVDVALVERGAHGVGALEGAQLDLVVLQLRSPLVVGVLGEDGLDDLVVLDLGLERVRPGAAHVEAVPQLVLVVVVGVDDARDRRGQLEREGGVRAVEVEDHLSVALGLDGVDGGQQREDPAVGLDPQGAVDGELHVLGGDRVAVRELEVLAQGAGVPLVARVGEAALLGGLGRRVAAAVGHDHQRLDGLAEDVPGADVVRGGRVERRRVLLRGGEPVGSADDDGVAAVVPAVGTAARGEDRGEQTDHGRQHQSLTVHARSSPELSSR
jgi:hypothetical protein